MPEGPEVKVMTDQLNQLIRGKCIQSIRLVSGPYKTHSGAVWKKTRDRVETLMRTLSDKNRAICVASVRNKGKFIYFNLIHLERQSDETGNNRIVEKGKVVLGSSLGLKGHWVYGSGTSSRPNHARIEITYSNKPVPKNDLQTLWYDDSMSQGKFNIETPEWLDKKLNTIGPDILGITAETSRIDEFLKRMKTKKAQKLPLFEAVMEQNLISGIGNYMRAELLYNVQENLKISPFVIISALSDKQLQDIWKNMQKSAQWIYENGGTTLATYKNVLGQSGKYEPRIYKKDTAPNGKPIMQKKGKGGRVFYYTNNMK